MCKIEITADGKVKTVFAEKGSILSSVLTENKQQVEHPCGFKGVCKKCTVLVNGKEELSCKYVVNSNISVTVFSKGEIESQVGSSETNKPTENMCLAFDIGTTTLALALVSLEDKKNVKSIVKTNPQRAFSSDVMGRIEYSTKNGTETLHKAVVDALNSMIEEMFALYKITRVEKLFVSGNTTMLHLFFNVDCSSMGVSPYTPLFINQKAEKAESMGIKGVDAVCSLPCISAFVGADIVAGLNYANMPRDGKYNVLIDLGTNAEVVVYSKKQILATAAAAGPCFEGVNISSGMSATEGAIYSYSNNSFKTIGSKKPLGICATGLIDVISELLQSEIIDETGYMECKEYEIFENVVLKQEDVRQFQLAKSAIFSALQVLLKRLSITNEAIEKVYVSGGFSNKMNVSNAIKTTLLPKEMKDKFVMINNSSLSGTVKYALENNDLSVFTKNAMYVDLSQDADFYDLFIENMMF